MPTPNESAQSASNDLRAAQSDHAAAAAALVEAQRVLEVKKNEYEEAKALYKLSLTVVTKKKHRQRLILEAARPIFDQGRKFMEGKELPRPWLEWNLPPET